MHKFFAPALLLIFVGLAACGPAQADVTPTPEQILNPIESPELVLAEETEFSADEITYLNSEQVTWSNACLEAPRQDEVCAQVLTRGFRISLDTPEGIYQIRTDESGEAYRIVPPGEAPEVDTAIVWERSGGIAGICQRLTIQFDGIYDLADCINEHTLSKGELSNQQWNQLSEWLQTYATFEYRSEIPEGSADMFVDGYVFNGRGDQVPPSETQEEINAQLAGLATELTSPPESITLASNSGIEGEAVLGPVCPGPQPEEGPRATECADQPYQANFTILDEQNNVIANFQTGEDGSFKVALAPGTYDIVPITDPAEVFPQAETQTVTVEEGAFTEVRIMFDTGIR